MKYFFYLIVTIVLFSCGSDNKSSNITSASDALRQQLLNAHKIPSQIVTIDIQKDTSFVTQKGATITIPKGAIKSNDGSTKVNVEIKEAYTIEDIFKAGLTTKSGKELLSSGGMIFINAENAVIATQIDIKVPSHNYVSGMQQFKGAMNKDGIIDWQNPIPLSGNSFKDTLELGKSIMVNNCSSCHSIDKDITGPALAFIPERRDKKWLNSYIRNSAMHIANGDDYANCLYEKWNKMAMTPFPNLCNKELDALYIYINEESKQLNKKQFPDFKSSFDSCVVYNNAKSQLLSKQAALIQQNGQQVTISQVDNGGTLPATNTTPSISINARSISQNEKYVIPKTENATYYQMSINTFGWYNVDIFFKDLPNFKPSELKVKINNQLDEQYNIYLILPMEKACVDGGLLKNEKDWYGFFTDDGKIPLPMGQKAYIIAFSEKNEKISFAMYAFTTEFKNEITMDAAEISMAAMQQEISKLQFPGLDMNVQETKNANELRKIKVDLDNVEKLKPKGADCNCMPKREGEKDGVDTALSNSKIIK